MPNLFGKNRRPVFNDSMLEELQVKIANDVFSWCGRKTPLDIVLGDTREVISRYSINENGYDLSKEFEKKGYSPDANLVELLESLWYHQSSIKEAHVRRWIKEDKILPERPIEDVVTYMDKEWGEVKGVITLIDLDRAYYVVNVKGKHKENEGTCINFEDILESKLKEQFV